MTKPHWWWFLIACCTTQLFSICYFLNEFSDVNVNHHHHHLRSSIGLTSPLPPPPCTPAPPCILIYTYTTPSFPLCTLDPQLDKWSKLARTTTITLMKSWPLDKLLDPVATKGRQHVVIDTMAGLGYFAFQASSLGSTVIAMESDSNLVQLMQTTQTLNQHRGNQFQINVIQKQKEYRCTTLLDTIAPRETDGTPVPVIDVLRIDATDVIQHCSKLLVAGRVKYMFVEFTPKSLQNPLHFLKTMANLYRFNVFEDEHASDGALEEKYFASLIKGIGSTSRTLFLAHNQFL
jgi:hypothetical protein